MVRPIEIYEVAHSNLNVLKNRLIKDSTITLRLKQNYSYKSNQVIKGTKNLTLISSVLTLKSNKFLKKNLIKSLTDKICFFFVQSKNFDLDYNNSNI